MSMLSKKAALLAKLKKELQGLYMAGALCSSDGMLEHVTREVMIIKRAQRRIKAIKNPIKKLLSL